MESASYFKARRKKILEKMQDNSVALLASAPIVCRNNDTEYPFRQDSYFYYLTGFNETPAIAVLVKKNGHSQFILFCQENDADTEQWTGACVGLQGACKQYGADNAYLFSELEKQLYTLLSGCEIVYYFVGLRSFLQKKLFSSLASLRKKGRQGLVFPQHFIDFRHLLSESRLIKTPEEIALLQQACNISAQAHIQAMRQCRPGMNEFELEAVLMYEFYRQGSRFPAYSSIVAGGHNACTLHYTKNCATLAEHDLVLIDAGAEYQGYAADITRTFPVNGTFSSEQKAIYELVLAAQKAGIDQVAPGIPWDYTQKAICEVLVQGLVDLKILKGKISSLIEEKAYLPFYMHTSGHWLGLDVHDVGDYKVDGQWRKLAPGMVLTVEPGLYFTHNNPKVPEKWRGIGVRIEDDVHVTKDGCEILSQGVPKEINDMKEFFSE